MKKIFLILFLLAGCGGLNHDQERTDVCSHIEGYQSGQCNAGDDFGELTCETTLAQYQGWWRGDVQTDVNHCIASFACYTDIVGTTGPSIVAPLENCLDNEMLSGLSSTEAQNKAVERVCNKFSVCGQLNSFTIQQCNAELLSPYSDGKVMLLMNDDLASKVAACDSSICIDFISCIKGIFIEANVFSTAMGSSISMPQLLNNMR